MAMFLREMLSRRTGDAELLSLLDRHAGVGLWDAVFHQGDPLHPASLWHWSGEFRRLLGFQDSADFPDAVGSWADRLHPEDAAPTFAAFAACLDDRSGRTGYDVIYRLRRREGDYHWFRAVGGVARDREGRALRACGSLIDINAQKLAEAEKRQALEALAARFAANVGGVVEQVESSASQMSCTAQSVAAATGQTQRSAMAATESVQAARTNVRAVAAAAAQLSAAIGEISRRMTEAAEVSAVAAEETRRTHDTVRSLAAAADRIGAVVSLIRQIANQTNLLALNATIEAARTGEAGRGFAVVANEVKTLAGQTARATEEIGAQIAAVQDETQRAVSLIGSIGGVIEQVREISADIAATIGQQGGATDEIARNVRRAAEETQHVADSIDGVMGALSVTGDASSHVQDCAGRLDRTVHDLRREVRAFLLSLR